MIAMFEMFEITQELFLFVKKNGALRQDVRVWLSVDDDMFPVVALGDCERKSLYTLYWDPSEVADLPLNVSTYSTFAYYCRHRLRISPQLNIPFQGILSVSESLEQVGRNMFHFIFLALVGAGRIRVEVESIKVASVQLSIKIAYDLEPADGWFNQREDYSLFQSWEFLDSYLRSDCGSKNK